MSLFNCTPEVVVVILATRSGISAESDIKELPSLIKFRDQPLIIYQIVNALQSGFTGL